jgi:hypothetical protein
MIKWIFPQPGDSFLGWIGRLFLIFMGLIGGLIFIGHIAEKNKPIDPPEPGWKGYDYSRPVSDIVYRDYETRTVYYSKGPYTGPTLNKSNNSSSKYSEEYLEDIFLDNDMANDYDDLYEKYRD